MPLVGGQVAEPIHGAQPINAGAGVGYQWIEVDGGTGYGQALIIAQTITTSAASTTTNIITMEAQGMNADAWREWNAVYTLTGGTGCNHCVTKYEATGWPFNVTYITAGG
jgi:hypothetical protein